MLYHILVLSLMNKTGHNSGLQHVTVSAARAGATAASLEQQFNLPSGTVSFINADNALSTPGGNITLPCARFLGWWTAAHVGISIALPSPKA